MKGREFKQWMEGRSMSVERFQELFGVSRASIFRWRRDGPPQWVDGMVELVDLERIRTLKAKSINPELLEKYKRRPGSPRSRL